VGPGRRGPGEATSTETGMGNAIARSSEETEGGSARGSPGWRGPGVATSNVRDLSPPHPSRHLAAEGVDTARERPGAATSSSVRDLSPPQSSRHLAAEGVDTARGIPGAATSSSVRDLSSPHPPWRYTAVTGKANGSGAFGGIGTPNSDMEGKDQTAGRLAQQGGEAGRVLPASPSRGGGGSGEPGRPLAAPACGAYPEPRRFANPDRLQSPGEHMEVNGTCNMKRGMGTVSEGFLSLPWPELGLPRPNLSLTSHAIMGGRPSGFTLREEEEGRVAPRSAGLRFYPQRRGGWRTRYPRRARRVQQREQSEPPCMRCRTPLTSWMRSRARSKGHQRRETATHLVLTSTWRRPFLFLGMVGTKDVEQVAHT